MAPHTVGAIAGNHTKGDAVMTYEIWKFETARFTVTMTAEPDYDVDLSFDETGEIREKLESGELQSFCAKCAVCLDGNEIAADYLGSCIYANPDEFRDHIGTGEIAFKDRTRRDVCAAFETALRDIRHVKDRHARGEVSTRYRNATIRDRLATMATARKEFAHRMRIAGRIGSYFSDMVYTACREARAHIASMKPTPHMRDDA
jgi:hypothetical protein